MRKTFILFLAYLFLTDFALAQIKQKVKSEDYLKMSWQQVASQMPIEWYRTNEARMVAENVLLTQKNVGGWAKNKPYHHILSEEEKAQFIKEKSETGATFDNGATITELKFLAKVYAYFKEERFKQAFVKGLNYVFTAQYDNGGWPQFFPRRQGNSVAYASHITYNDDAMVNITSFLKDIYTEKGDYPVIRLTNDMKQRAKKSFDKGVKCILATQIKVNGSPTVWCAQHDEHTLAPTNARKYELASFSGAESVGITQLLMEIENPSEEIIASVNGAVKWFENSKIEDIKVESEIDKEGRKNLIVVADKSAPPLWARFYDLETQQPFFCDRDGIRKNSLAEIGHERRNGYAWYTNTPAKILKAYPEWRRKWNIR